jgi:SAM-dependent methyltransferase
VSSLTSAVPVPAPASAAAPASPGALQDGTTAADLAEQLFEGAVATLELATVHLGLRLGLYQVLRDRGAMTPPELAREAAIDARFAREWLEQQAMAGLVGCDDPRAPEEGRVYALPDPVAEVLLDPASAAFLGPLAHLAVGVLSALPDVELAYRTGAGVPFERYGDDLRHGLATLNGATFDRELAGWIAAMPDLDARLRDGEAPRILDLGCGLGRSTLALARAYPRAAVRGVDLDRASIEAARGAAAAAGLAHRVTFTVGDAADPAAVEPPAATERYDLVTVFEALHDMGDPVGALRTAAGARREGAAVLVADQLTRDHLVTDGDPLERFQYGCSVLHCLPATRAEPHLVAHGTVLRPPTVDDWARRAGFTGATVLDIEDPFWRFYRL